VLYGRLSAASRSLPSLRLNSGRADLCRCDKGGQGNSSLPPLGMMFACTARLLYPDRVSRQSGVFFFSDPPPPPATLIRHSVAQRRFFFQFPSSLHPSLFTGQIGSNLHSFPQEFPFQLLILLFSLLQARLGTIGRAFSCLAPNLLPLFCC